MNASYFYTTEDATVMRKTQDCLFYLDLVNINFDLSNLSKKEEKVMDKKYCYLSTLEANLKFLKFDQIFHKIYKKLGDPDLCEELAFSYVVVYDILEFYQESCSLVQRLLTRYLRDQYLIIKKARLLSKMREFEE